jgi:hypothetical protein
MNAKKVERARKLYDSRQHTVADIAEILNVSVATITDIWVNLKWTRWPGNHPLDPFLLAQPGPVAIDGSAFRVAIAEKMALA